MAQYIDTFKQGQELDLENGRKVFLDHLIGDGYTAVVYTAKMIDQEGNKEEVVVKIAKDHEDAERLVGEECQILKELYSDIQFAGKPLTPRLYGKGKFQNRTLIVMEFVKARPIFNPAGLQALSELEALTIGLQFFTFLEGLHRKKNWAYPDMKDENLLWSSEDHTGGLRIIDLGGLEHCSESEDDPRYERDVLRAATYFFSMVAGRQLATSIIGEIQEDPNIAIGNLENVSSGLRALLSKLLCRNRDFRLKDAHNARIEIEILCRFWNESSEKLVDIILANLEKAGSLSFDNADQKINCSRRASNALDIYIKRFPEKRDDVTGVATRAKALEESTAHLTRAKVSMQVGQWNEAIRTLSEGEYLSNQPQVFRRWKYIAESIPVIPKEEISDFLALCDEIFTCVSKGNLQTALQACADQRLRYPDAQCFSLLANDIQLFHALEESQKFELNGDYSRAAESLRQAKEYLESLPDKVNLVKNHIGDLNLQIICLESKKEESEKTSIHPDPTELTAMDEMVRRGQVADVVKKFFEILRIAPINKEFQQKLSDWMIFFLENQQIPQAYRIGELVWFISEPSTELVALRNLSQGIKNCVDAINRLDAYAALFFLKQMDQVQIEDRIIRPIRKKCIQRIMQKEIVDESKSLLNKFVDYCEQVGEMEIRSDLQKKISEISSREIKQTQQTLNWIKFDLMAPEMWRSEVGSYMDMLVKLPLESVINTIDQQGAWLADIEKQLNVYKDDEIVQNELKKEYDELRMELERQNEIYKQIHSINQELMLSSESRSEKILAAWNQFYMEYAPYLQNGSALVDQNLRETIEERLFRFIEVILNTTRTSGDMKLFEQIGLSVLSCYDALGYQAWESIKAKVKDTPEAVHTELAQIQKMFEEGNLIPAIMETRKLDAISQMVPEVIDLRIKMLRALAYEKAVERYSAVISRQAYDQEFMLFLLENRKLKLPASFFRKSGVEQYLKTLQVQQKAKVRTRKVSGADLLNGKKKIDMDTFRCEIEKALMIESAIIAVTAY